MRFKFPRWIPEGSRAHQVEGVDAVAYLSEKNGAFYAIAYAGKAVKATFNYRFRTEANRQAHVDNFFACQKSAAESRAKRAAARKAFVHTLKVGDILNTNWGYDQTNIEFFEVTAVAGKHVIVRQLAQDSETTGFLCGQCVPVPGQYCGPPIRKIVCEGNSLKMSDWGRYAHVYQRQEVVPGVKVGRPLYWSAYA